MQLNKHRSLTRKGAYALFCVFISLISFSQSTTNLINNHSGEQYKTCSFGGGLITNANFWYSPTGGTPDYFNSCLVQPFTQVPISFFGNQSPRIGNAYMGFISYGGYLFGEYKEYLGNGLKQTLKSNKNYCITFYVSLAEYSRKASANIGYLFSKDSILNKPSPVALGLTPDFETTTIITDTTNWIEIQGTFLASGIERFITIGNFRTDVNTNGVRTKPAPSSGEDLAYYFIDDISIIEINAANVSIKDSLISRCFMDSVLLGTDSTEFATYTWSSTATGLAALSCTNCPNPIAKPLVTTKYYLSKQQCGVTTMDSVTVVVLTPTTQANAGNDKTICIGEYTQLGTADSLAFTNYTWQNAATLSCSNCAMPFANPNVTTTYTVQRTECANLTTDTVRIIIDDCDPTYTIPNVFTPNYDDVNDTWGINFSTVNSRIKDFKMNIYDRWGLLIYSTNSERSTPNSKWDGHTNSGEECSEGVYYYIVTFEKNEEHILLKGHLSLFR